ncbi:MAG TPA: single-stranded DNA-binding protein [Candidatus Bathyarchaeia archaeon]|nr:single-stranded DNA-binding protein [Candidatus Bathyarchaeia archaeon]
MASFNRIILIGNLTRDPDYKTLSSGQAVCRLGIATNRQFRNKQTGNMTQEVCFIDIDVWGAQAETCRQYLQKGRSVLIEGRLKFDSWQDQAGGGTKSRHSVVADRVVFLGQGASTETTTSTEYEASDNSFSFAKQESSGETELGAASFGAQPKPKPSFVKNISKKSGAHLASSSAEVGDIEVSRGGEIDMKDEPPFEDDLPF